MTVQGDADASSGERQHGQCHPDVVLVPCPMAGGVDSAVEDEPIAAAEGDDSKAYHRDHEDVHNRAVHGPLSSI